MFVACKGTLFLEMFSHQTPIFAFSRNMLRRSLDAFAPMPKAQRANVERRWGVSLSIKRCVG